MIKTILSFVILILCTSELSHAQQTELDKRNGFKTIQLTSPIDSVKGTKLKKEFTEKNGAAAKLFTVSDPEYARIGEIKVNNIELKTYKDLIYEITVFTEKDPRLMRAMESVLGKAQYDARHERYFWAGENLVLTFESSGKKELMLVYKSHLIEKMMKEDKEKKVEEIADEF